MDGGAWPFLVGGVICLVNSDNERDSVLLNRPDLFLFQAGQRRLRFVFGGASGVRRGGRVAPQPAGRVFFLEGLAIVSRTR